MSISVRLSFSLQNTVTLTELVETLLLIVLIHRKHLPYACLFVVYVMHTYMYVVGQKNDPTQKNV